MGLKDLHAPCARGIGANIRLKEGLENRTTLVRILKPCVVNIVITCCTGQWNCCKTYTTNLYERSEMRVRKKNKKGEKREKGKKPMARRTDTRDLATSSNRGLRRETTPTLNLEATVWQKCLRIELILWHLCCIERYPASLPVRCYGIGFSLKTL